MSSAFRCTWRRGCRLLRDSFERPRRVRFPMPRCVAGSGSQLSSRFPRLLDTVRTQPPTYMRSHASTASARPSSETPTWISRAIDSIVGQLVQARNSTTGLGRPSRGLRARNATSAMESTRFLGFTAGTAPRLGRDGLAGRQAGCGAPEAANTAKGVVACRNLGGESASRMHRSVICVRSQSQSHHAQPGARRTQQADPPSSQFEESHAFDRQTLSYSVWSLLRASLHTWSA